MTFPPSYVEHYQMLSGNQSRLYLSSCFIFIIIIIIIIIDCNLVVTRWQWLFYMYAKYEIGYY